MAGMALQCLKETAMPVKSKGELEKALTTIKQKIVDSQRADGHLGNEFSTGLAVQVRLRVIQVDQTSAHLGSGSCLKYTNLSERGVCLSVSVMEAWFLCLSVPLKEVWALFMSVSAKEVWLL